MFAQLEQRINLFRLIRRAGVSYFQARNKPIQNFASKWFLEQLFAIWFSLDFAGGTGPEIFFPAFQTPLCLPNSFIDWQIISFRVQIVK